jgi:acyl-CoA synthetase (AMP-forming)/AMP-acid ligase II/acetyltransferase-like isoleucine patch superfamily enzyme
MPPLGTSLASGRSALMPDGATVLNGFFGAEHCDASICEGVGECNEECDRLKSMFYTSFLPDMGMSFVHPTGQIPFSGPPQPSMRLGVIVMHGVLREAEKYLCRMFNAVVRNVGSEDVAMSEVVLVAPHIQAYHKTAISIGAVPVGELVWTAQPPARDKEYGGFSEDVEDLNGWATGGNSTGSPSLSSFTIMDEMVRGLANRTRYPNLNSILIVGHSEGGSFVQRYALATRVEERLPPEVQVSYHIANPSVLTYMGAERPVQPKKYKCDFSNNRSISNLTWDFAAPTNETSSCPIRSNDWPYGLAGNRLPEYVSQNWFGPRFLGLRRAYLDKAVTLYSGLSDTCNQRLKAELDCKPRDCKLLDRFLETTCSAMEQGPNRMARIHAYMQQPDVQNSQHTLVTVPHVGHSSCLMFQSDAMRSALFGADQPSPPNPPPMPPIEPGVLGVATPRLPLTVPAVLFLIAVTLVLIVICCLLRRGCGLVVEECVVKPASRKDVPCANTITKLVAARRKDCSTLASSATAMLPPYECLAELFPSTSSNAICSPDPERPACTHARLRRFVLEEVPANLGAFGVASGERVAAILPNGTESVGATLGLLSYVTLVPINIASTQDEIAKQLAQCRVTCVLLLKGATVPNEVCLAAARGLQLLVLEAAPLAEAAGLFRIQRALACARSAKEPPKPNSPDDMVLLLMTSGTTGNKKVVPHRLQDCIAGAVCLAVGQDLSPTDVCCNAMPLFHVGGIMRCVLAPTLSGGSVVPMPYFDADWFLANITAHNVSWYYASPTIHQSILDSYLQKPVPHRLRMIANAAAPLPANLAVKMRDAYSAPGRRCVLMPSYGMTECMPISAPPLDYNLERPGSSGRQLGPKLEIHTAEGEEVPRGQVGHIALQDQPVMRGYEGGTGAEFINGWFHTGDDGYIDNEGNLYVVARSKEAINRGGETIIPAEIEAALLTHPAIKAVACFAMPHGSLQETVGAVVVPSFGFSRISLSALIKHASRSLHSSKWPAVLVYAEAMPLNTTGKLVRVKLAQRMGLASIDDDTPENERVYEMLGPPSKVPAEPIPVKRVMVKTSSTSRTGFLEFLSARFARQSQGEISETEKALLDLYQSLRTSADTDSVTVEDDLILLGTSSIQMGELGSRIKLRFGTSLPPTVMFAPPRSIRSIAAAIDDKLDQASMEGGSAATEKAEGQPAIAPADNPDPPPSMSQFGVAALFVQILPILAFRPLARTCAFVILTLLLIESHGMVCNDMLNRYELDGFGLSSCYTSHFLLCIFITWCIVSITLPFFAMLVKWVVIGRYKEGMYPLWGSYYLRWWLVHRVVEGCGMGPLFRYNNAWRCRYYRLLGAKIGANVKISSSAQISEYDLVSIGDGVVIDSAVVSPFAAQAGTMILKPVVMGQLSGLCVSTVLGPGESLPYGVVIGPLSCGHEAKDSALEAVSKHHRKLCRASFPEPSLVKQIFIGYPCMFFVGFCHMLPYISCLMLLIIQFSTIEMVSSGLLARWSERVLWLVSPWRLGAVVLAVAARSSLSPFTKLAAVILVKRLIVGPFRAGTKGDWEHFQYWLMSKLTGKTGPLCGAHALLGKHHSGVSMALRALGVRVGKRVFWPGVELKLVEFDLLTVGDDVVFGSRSYVFCSDAEESAPVTLAAGAMVADRCVLLPGVTVERNAVMGSGALGKAGTTYPPGCTAIGSVCGDCVLLDPGSKKKAMQDDETTQTAPLQGVPDTGGPDTLKPFGRVFYTRNPSGSCCYPNPPAFIFSLFAFIVTALSSVANASVWLTAVYTATHAMAFESEEMYAAKVDPKLGALVITRYVFTVVGYCVLFRAFALTLASAAGVGYKWVLIGRRKPGAYDWDKSSYNARWKLYTTVSFIDLGEICGSAYMVLWYRALGCKMGPNVCLWPQGSDLFLTEPDLVEMGESVCLNQKSGVVCHLNSRGGFSLSPITLGDRASCRALTKVTGGASMGDDALMLEHTLLMPGEELGPGEKRQGWISLEN